MENDIALIASGYLLARLGVLAGFAYLVYRVLRPARSRVRIQSQSEYASERYTATRLGR